jgi:hypothetical protein
MREREHLQTIAAIHTEGLLTNERGLAGQGREQVNCMT